MNDLDWRNLWDLVLIEQEQRDVQREQERVLREAGVLPASTTARFSRALGTLLVTAGQRLGAEPVTVPAHAPYSA